MMEPSRFQVSVNAKYPKSRASPLKATNVSCICCTPLVKYFPSCKVTGKTEVHTIRLWRDIHNCTHIISLQEQGNYDAYQQILQHICTADC